MLRCGCCDREFDWRPLHAHGVVLCCSQACVDKLYEGTEVPPTTLLDHKIDTERAEAMLTVKEFKNLLSEYPDDATVCVVLGTGKFFIYKDNLTYDENLDDILITLEAGDR